MEHRGWSSHVGRATLRALVGSAATATKRATRFSQFESEWTNEWGAWIRFAGSVGKGNLNISNLPLMGAF